ncbi:MAG: HAD family hydrolase [Planctomycetes bacterium]|nr:HAD family hydrolase [Planctomycetota bacterium]
MHFKAILFDLDGTLLNTLEDLGTAANYVLKKNGFPIHTIDDYRFFVGDGIAVLMKRALPEDKRSEDIIRLCIQAYREEYSRNWKVKTRPYDGITEMLDALTSRHLKMAVLSNKPDEFTKQCVNEFFLRWTFDAVLGQRSSLPIKPDPSGAIEIARCLNISPANFIYLGDTAIDMKTATASGMFPAGAMWGFRSEKELQENGAGVLLKTPLEVIRLLDLE